MPTDDSMQAVETRTAVERGLAIIGFVALVGCGIWLAFYSAQFVPTAVNRIGTAAVALSSMFIPGGSSLTVVPTASTTVPFENTATTSKPAVTKPAATKPVATTPGSATTGAYPIGATTTPVGTTTPFGLPDLKAEILATGYLTGTSTDSFVATSSVPKGARPAVKFTIANIGSNIVATGWHFSAAIPTQNAYVFYSPAQPALNPGDAIEYTLGFDQASAGVNRSISIVADSDQKVGESVEGNNSATASITILAN